ncbi:PREDICTED: 2-acylglycerol O-acyltransferase 2-like, partial [Pseudopodoces humilis]|uniref:2-acylglycerol O-acyltransferase 2-like n=1 Tax=Pseudopodoces humilis TaxID=181119 RepID=UPI0006B7F778
MPPLQFAPLRLPLRRRLQTLAVLQWVFSFLLLGQLCTLLFVLALRGPLWPLALLYALWLLADRDTPRRGGRPCAWVRAWPVWRHFRDYFPISVILGLVSSDPSSLEHLLAQPRGGRVAVIALGGPPEALEARPGGLRLQLLRRRGFVRIALKHGTPLVPVFSFGENELFRQVPNPPGSRLRRLQLRLQKVLGVALPLFHARGIFQYNFGLLPFRRPIHTV